MWPGSVCDLMMPPISKTLITTRTLVEHRSMIV